MSEGCTVMGDMLSTGVIGAARLPDGARHDQQQHLQRQHARVQRGDHQSRHQSGHTDGERLDRQRRHRSTASRAATTSFLDAQTQPGAPAATTSSIPLPGSPTASTICSATRPPGCRPRCRASASRRRRWPTRRRRPPRARQCSTQAQAPDQPVPGLPEQPQPARQSRSTAQISSEASTITSLGTEHRQPQSADHGGAGQRHRPAAQSAAGSAQQSDRSAVAGRQRQYRARRATARINVFIGSGQPLVVGAQRRRP